MPKRDKRKKKKGSKKNKKKDKTIQDLLNEQGYDPRQGQEKKMLQDRLRQRERNRNIRDRVKRSRQIQTRRNNRRDMYNTRAGTGREGMRRRQLGETQNPASDPMFADQANRGGSDEPGRNFARTSALRMAGDESTRPRTPSQSGRHAFEDPVFNISGNTGESMVRDSHGHYQEAGIIESIARAVVSAVAIPFSVAIDIVKLLWPHIKKKLL